MNLSEDPIRGAPHNPGSGGWPTIRYFNAETGLAGASYVKKTDKPMCEELGKFDSMSAYVEEAGKTSLCSAADEKGCDEKEVAYIRKMKLKTAQELTSQLDRLSTMEGGSMKPELKAWLVKRKKILTQIVASSPQDDL